MRLGYHRWRYLSLVSALHRHDRELGNPLQYRERDAKRIMRRRLRLVHRTTRHARWLSARGIDLVELQTHLRP